MLRVKTGEEIGAAWARLPRVVRAVAREPLFHFLLLGVLLWSTIAHVQYENDERFIRIGPNQIRQITESYRAQYGKPPSVSDLGELLQQFVDDEVAYREGTALGLGHGDEIVRRRIIQKYQFLQNDLSAPSRPSVEILRAWFANHRQNYVEPSRASFTHLYFSPDAAGDRDARSRAQAAMVRLAREASPSTIASDEFSGPENVSDQTPDSAERLFGKSDFVRAIFNVPTAQWEGPFRSGFGWHVIFVSHRSSPQVPGFEIVQDKVMTDYLDEQQKRANQRQFAAVRAKYKIVMDEAAQKTVMDEATR